MWQLSSAHPKKHAEKTQQELVSRLLDEERLYLILDLDQTILHATYHPVDFEEYEHPEEIHHFQMNSGYGLQDWYVKVVFVR